MLTDGISVRWVDDVDDASSLRTSRITFFLVTSVAAYGFLSPPRLLIRPPPFPGPFLLVSAPPSHYLRSIEPF